jgi:hypothetical protein
VVYEATEIMEESLKARTQDLSNLLTYKEVLYFFWRVASWLKHLKDNKVYYGCLQRKNLRVDKDNKFKLALYPVMRNSYELAVMRMANNRTLNYNLDEPPHTLDRQAAADREYLFSPELLSILKRDTTSIKGFTFMNWELNDIWVLAMWCLYFIDKKTTQRTVNLDQFYIDYKAIYNEVKTVAIMINSKFADLIRGCLMGNLNERLNIDQVDELCGTFFF